MKWNIGWTGSCAICALGTFILGLGLVWLNIELVGLSYEIRDLQNRLQKERVLQDKLEVERMNLSSSYRLREKAGEMGLRPPGSGEVIKVE
ncbi:MAG: hypothetical protein R6U22_05225 [Desulfohalobiaceae bacterium]